MNEGTQRLPLAPSHPQIQAKVLPFCSNNRIYDKGESESRGRGRMGQRGSYRMRQGGREGKRRRELRQTGREMRLREWGRGKRIANKFGTMLSDPSWIRHRQNWVPDDSGFTCVKWLVILQSTISGFHAEITSASSPLSQISQKTPNS